MITTLLLTTSFAAEFTLTPTQDSTLGVAPVQTGWGADEHLHTGKAGSRERRTLVQFDFSALPSDAVVVSAVLTLQANQAEGGPIDLDVHRLTTPWTEGTENPTSDLGSTSPTGATWRYSQISAPQSQWNSVGGDFDAFVMGSTVVDGVGTYTFDLDTGEIEAIIDGSASYAGLLLRDPTPTSNTLKRFNSREGGGMQPTLTVITDDGPPPDTVTDAVDAMADIANDAFGSTVIVDSSPGSERFEKGVIADKLRALLEDLKENDCLVEAQVQSYAAGAYRSGSSFFGGEWESGPIINTVLDHSTKEFSGEFAGGGGNFGLNFSDYENFQVVADHDGSGYMAGVLVRVQGTRGVFLTLHGHCNDTQTPEAGVNAWWSGVPVSYPL